MSGVSNLLRPVRIQLYVACLVQAIGAAASVVPYIAVAEIARSIAFPPFDPDTVWLFAVIGAAAVALQLVCVMIANLVTHIADNDLQLHIRRRLNAHLARLPLGWFHDTHSGKVKKALQDDIVEMHHLVGHAYLNLTSAVVAPVIALLYLMYLNWLFGLLSILPIALGLSFYAVQMSGMGPKIDQYDQTLAAVNAAAVELAQAVSIIKTFGNQSGAESRFQKRTQAFIDFFWQMVRGQLAGQTILELFLSPVFSVLWLVTIGLLLVAGGQLQVLELIAFLVLAPGLASPFLTLAYTHHELITAQKAAGRIITILEEPTLPQAVSPVKLGPATARRVTFRNVTFAYTPGNDAIAGVSFEVAPGTMTALVGPSGSGKSTIARLLPRFWDPTGGTIEIDGVPIAQLASDDLYREVSFVFQETHLLRMSIADNIGYAKRSCGRSAVENAATMARAHDFITSLPRGYDSVVGEDTHLSGGEAQRIAIARALLADTPILVLDEATSFADPECEAEIQQALSELVRHRTTLVIAHRLQTVADADQICVMDQGRLVERGRHSDLVVRGGLYATMWSALTSEHDAPREVAE